jgi:hypothetical protein
VTAIGGGRLVRICDLCGGVDDHPRHVIHGDPGDPPDQAVVARLLADDGLDPDLKAALLADLYDTTLQLRHLDCCADAGCPDGTCVTQTAGAKGKTGAAMLTHLMAKADRA